MNQFHYAEDMGSRWSSYESLTSEKRDDIFITSPESDASSRPVPRPGKNSLNAPLVRMLQLLRQELRGGGRALPLYVASHIMIRSSC